MFMFTIEKFTDFVCWCKIQNNHFYEKTIMGWEDGSDIKISKKKS